MDKGALVEWIRSNPGEAQRVRDAYYMTRVRLAREDINEFVELVMRDEETGKPLKQASIHEDFQRLINQNDRLLLWSYIESGKTTQMIARALFELGRNPRLRVVIASHTVRYATKIVSAVKRYIERPGPLHDVFPQMREGDLWTMSAFTLDIGKASGPPKDPSCQATGIGINSILGARIDFLILDDVLTLDNTRTEQQRQQAWDWYHATLAGRLTDKARIVVVGTAYHPDDLMHRFAVFPEWHWRKFPALRAKPDGTTESIWPKRWPAERIERKRRELHPHEFARQMLCVPRDDSESRFKREWIDKCLKLGEGRSPAYALISVPPGIRVYTGVDIGVRTKSNSDLTVLFTIAVNQYDQREVLWVESGRWGGPDIVERIIDTHRRYHSIIFVESVAAQQFILDFTKQLSAVPVLPFNTGKNKLHPEFGVESIAAEMANGKWTIPAVDGRPATKEIDAWVSEMLYYDPNAHTGDRLMASWFAREGSRQPKPKRLRTMRLDTLSR